MNEPVETILKRFDEPDEVRQMTLGKFEIVRVGGLAIGRARRVLADRSRRMDAHR